MGIRFDSLQKSSKIHELKARSEFNGGLHHLNVLKAVALVLVILFAYQFANPALSSAAGSLHRRDSGTLANSTLSPASSFDFSLSDSGGITVNPGSSGSNTITVTLVTGSTQPVTLSVSGLPSGATPGFSGGVGCGGAPICTVTPNPTISPTLTITTMSSTSCGSYAITVTGAGGGLTDASQFTLIVNGNCLNFYLSDSGGIAVSQGGSGSNTITVTLVSGPTQGVTLNVSGFPSGGSAAFFDGCMGQPTCTVSPTRSVTLTITTSSSTSPGVYIITVKGVGGGLTDTSQFTLTVNSSGNGFDFSLSNNGGITVSPGGSGSSMITVTLVSGPTQGVTLSVSGLPSGATPGFSTHGCGGALTCTVTPTVSVTLTITTSSSTPAGMYAITVTGAGGGLTDTSQFWLRVNGNGFDFSLSNSGGIAVSQGGSGSNTITVTLVTGSTQPVTLSVSGLPSGATPGFSGGVGCGGAPTCTVTPNPTISPVLTIMTLYSTPPGMYTITVTGAGGSLTDTFQFTLIVIATPIVCITPTTSATSCPNGAPSIGPQTLGSTFTIGVFIQSSDAMGGFDISVRSDPALVNPIGAALGNLIVGPLSTAICINGFNGGNTGGTCEAAEPGGNGPGYDNGPGVVQVTTMKASGLNECGGVSPCSGMAFTITYQAVGSTPSTPLFFPSAPPCFVSSVSSPANVCVLVASYPDGATLPENIQGATITVSTSPSSSATNIYDASTGAPWSGTEATGASSYDTSSVTGVAGVTPTGSVTYTFFTTGDCSGVGTSESPPGGSLLSDGLVPNSLTVGPLAAGTYSFQATYSGDSSYLGSTSSCEPFSVNKVSNVPITTSVVSETTGVTGSTWHDTSTIFGVSGFPPTGTVDYDYWTNGGCTDTPTSLFYVLINPDGSVPDSPSVGPLAAGSYSFLVNYFGDNNYWGSNSVCETFTVNKAPTTTTIGLTETVGSGADSVSWTVPPSGGFTLGAILRVSSTVGTQIDGFSITGSVTYSLYSGCSYTPAWCVTGQVAPCTGILVQTSNLPVGATPPNFGGTLLYSGPYCFVATYIGDSNYLSSTISIVFNVD